METFSANAEESRGGYISTDIWVVSDCDFFQHACTADKPQDGGQFQCVQWASRLMLE